MAAKSKIMPSRLRRSRHVLFVSSTSPNVGGLQPTVRAGVFETSVAT
jgi:hypothetical protein